MPSQDYKILCATLKNETEESVRLTLYSMEGLPYKKVVRIKSAYQGVITSLINFKMKFNRYPPFMVDTWLDIYIRQDPSDSDSLIILGSEIVDVEFYALEYMFLNDPLRSLHLERSLLDMPNSNDRVFSWLEDSQRGLPANVSSNSYARRPTATFASDHRREEGDSDSLCSDASSEGLFGGSSEYRLYREEELEERRTSPFFPSSSSSPWRSKKKTVGGKGGASRLSRFIRLVGSKFLPARCENPRNGPPGRLGNSIQLFEFCESGPVEGHERKEAVGNVRLYMISETSPGTDGVVKTQPRAVVDRMREGVASDRQPHFRTTGSGWSRDFSQNGNVTATATGQSNVDLESAEFTRLLPADVQVKRAYNGLRNFLRAQRYREHTKRIIHHQMKFSKIFLQVPKNRQRYKKYLNSSWRDISCSWYFCCTDLGCSRQFHCMFVLLLFASVALQIFLFSLGSRDDNYDFARRAFFESLAVMCVTINEGLVSSLWKAAFEEKRMCLVWPECECFFLPPETYCVYFVIAVCIDIVCGSYMALVSVELYELLIQRYLFSIPVADLITSMLAVLGIAMCHDFKRKLIYQGLFSDLYCSKKFVVQSVFSEMEALVSVSIVAAIGGYICGVIKTTLDLTRTGLDEFFLFHLRWANTSMKMVRVSANCARTFLRQIGQCLKRTIYARYVREMPQFTQLRVRSLDASTIEANAALARLTRDPTGAVDASSLLHNFLTFTNLSDNMAFLLVHYDDLNNPLVVGNMESVVIPTSAKDVRVKIRVCRMYCCIPGYCNCPCDLNGNFCCRWASFFFTRSFRLLPHSNVCWKNLPDAPEIGNGTTGYTLMGARCLVYSCCFLGRKSIHFRDVTREVFVLHGLYNPRDYFERRNPFDDLINV